MARLAAGAVPVTDAPVGERITALQAEIAHHDELYFKQAAPEISDADYDRLKRRLAELEQAHPEAARPARVGDDRSGRFPTQAHRQRMLSLDKAYTEAEWRTFYASTARRLGRSDPVFVVEPKYDGLAISLLFAHGVLTHATTRGNGAEGDDVTENVRAMPGLPRELRGNTPGGTANPVPELVELRGEIYVDHAEFARINAQREADGEEPFAHPRNLAAGTLKSSDAVEVSTRRLSLVVYAWGAWVGEGAPASQQAFHAQVRAWGWPGIGQFEVVASADAGWAAIAALGRERSALGYPIDGAVVKLDEVAARVRLGESEHAPRWAIACKYEPERAVARLQAIVIQVGRTGVLTPVAEFEPVMLGGARVTRATLHNRLAIARQDVRVGDFIEVEKAGEIIPAVGAVQLDRRPAGAESYVFPVRCPSCDAALEIKADEAAVRCPSAACPAQRQRRLEHFAAALNLEGLGPATIEILVRERLVTRPADFYRLQPADLDGVEGLSAKVADKFLASINRSKGADLWRFIYALGIPQIGAANSRKLAAASGDLGRFGQLDAAQLTKRVGPSAARSAASFLGRSENQEELSLLLAAGVRPRAAPQQAVTADVRTRVFVFTGTLPAMSRAEAAERIQVAGGEVHDSVSRTTDYLVAGTGAGQKLAEARKLGVKVINADEFVRLLEPE